MAAKMTAKTIGESAWQYQCGVALKWRLWRKLAKISVSAYQHQRHPVVA
jgi:hypothetical protein